MSWADFSLEYQYHSVAFLNDNAQHLAKMHLKTTVIKTVSLSMMFRDDTICTIFITSTIESPNIIQSLNHFI